MVLLDACDDFNCNPTCQTKLLPGTREETDGALVWTVIFATLAVVGVLLVGGEVTLVKVHPENAHSLRRARIIATMVCQRCGVSHHTENNMYVCVFVVLGLS